MMAPCYETERMLATAVATAAPMLDGPIDRMTEDGRHIRFWSGRQCVAVQGLYQQHYGPNGEVLVGSGHYEAKGWLTAGTIGGGFWRRLFGWRFSEADKQRRAGIVSVAIHQATMELMEPVDGLEVRSDGIFVSAGTKSLVVTDAEKIYDEQQNWRPA